MTTLIILIASSVLGGVGWWIGAFVGTFTAFVISTITSGIGIYVGRRIAQEYLP